MNFDMSNSANLAPSKKKGENVVLKHYKKPKLDNGLDRKFVKTKNAKKFVEEWGQHILDGGSISALLGESFEFASIVEYLLCDFKLTDVEVSISTLSMSGGDIGSLWCALHRIKSLDLVISANFFAKNRHIVELIYEELDEDNKLQVSVSSTHTKNILMKIGDKKIVFHGSANLRSSECVEFLQVETNDELYDFLKEYHDTIKEKYSTINKDVIDPLKKKPIRNRNPHMEENSVVNNFYENEEEEEDLWKICGVMVDRHPEFRTTKCFYFLGETDEGNYKDIFSYRLAINGSLTDMQTFSRACRFTVHERIRKFKIEQFKNRPVRCVISNEIVEWEECQVDHKSPLTFSVIVKSFMIANNLDISKIEYTYHNSREIFVDETISKKFYDFHRQMAVLRIVSTTENLKLSGSARVKPTQKDTVLDD